MLTNVFAAPWYVLDMTALALLSDRLEKVLDLREMSQRELSERAGLTSTHVGTLLRLPPEKQERTGVWIIKRIAKAGDVRFAWLAANEGAMLEPGTPDPLRFMARLEQTLRSRGMEAVDLDRALGKRPGFTARTWLRAQRELPNAEDVMSAAKLLHVSFEWLRFGIGAASDPAPAADATALETTLRTTLEASEAATQAKAAERRVPGRKKRRSIVTRR